MEEGSNQNKDNTKVIDEDTHERQAAERSHVAQSGVWKAVALIAIGAAVLLALLAFCMSLAALQNRPANRLDNFQERVLRGSDRAGLRGGMMNGVGGFGQNSDTHISGVVSAVNGDTLTVIGHGESKTIKTTTDTSYNGTKDGNKPAVNDSVNATGTTSGDTFTATAIRVMN